MLQRFCDIIFSVTAIFFLLPILLPILLLLRFTGEGEIFYQQKRVGKNRKEFFVNKFATMLKNSPNLGTGTITIKDDPRVLPIGKLFAQLFKVSKFKSFIFNGFPLEFQ